MKINGRARFRLTALGIGLAALHTLLLILVVASKPPLGGPVDPTRIHPNAIAVDPYHSSGAVVADRAFHFQHERAAVKVLSLLDLPTLVCTVCISRPLSALAGLELYTASWVDGILWLLLGAVQWFWVGGLFSSGANSSEAFNP